MAPPQTLMEQGAALKSPMASAANKRITTRVTDHVQSQLEAAASLIGATVNQFVVQAALEKAERLIEQESVIRLSRKGSEWLLDRLENPRPRNEKFLKAQDDYRRTVKHADRSDLE